MKATPFRQFVLKVHSRCNLSCSYCYVYEMADQSWRSQPLRMSDSTIEYTIHRMAEHVRKHGLESVSVVLHGGEPLLAGIDFIARLVEMLRARVPVPVDVRVQTNGVLLTEAVLRRLMEQRVRVGVSLDGDARATERHRRFADGRSSYGQVRQALQLLASDEFRACYDGILCTIDLSNDPVVTYQALLDYSPPAIDFLLPHGNWSNAPPGRPPYGSATPYANWLLTIFDRWYLSPAAPIRLFQELIQLILGGTAAVEGLGLQPSTVIFVDTGGAIKQLDSLSATYPGAPDTGLNVVSDSFDAALAHPLTILRQDTVASLCATCSSCSIVQICGGGLLPHRYHTRTGFVNPSVYCPDLLHLITTIRARVLRDISQAISRARCPR